MHQNRYLLVRTSQKGGHSVVYIMSRDQRIHDNFALLMAQDEAIKLSLPLVVVFDFKNKIHCRAYEHFEFMLRGLEEVAQNLKQLNISFVITAKESSYTMKNCLEELQPSRLYFDFSPLNGARQYIKSLAAEYDTTTYVVDNHNIIPTWVASDKQEFAAHTFRRKVHKHLRAYLLEPEKIKKHSFEATKNINTLTFHEAYQYIARYPKRGITITETPGEHAARQHIATFIDQGLLDYAKSRNIITTDGQSRLSPYLHFGHISSLRVALDVLRATHKTPLLFEQPKMASPGENPSKYDGMNALFEEMIVRKELSDNFCFYGMDYRSLKSIPAWAVATLTEHRDDPRAYIYNLHELQEAQTHDIAWNSAQNELTKTGKMHGYMRMYWAKKILEWTNSPEEALQFTIQLNDSYSIDGGDPNGYTGILWSIAGLHDRPWIERPIFGKIRYMNQAGLKRKFDLDGYVKRINDL